MAEFSPYSSVRITERLMIAAIDGDAEAQAIVDAWRPQFKITTIAADDPAIKESITFEG